MSEYQFPRTAIINHHKLGGFIQLKFIYLFIFLLFERRRFLHNNLFHAYLLTSGQTLPLLDLWLLKKSDIPGMNPIWSWCMIFLIYFWVQITSMLVSHWGFLHLCSSVMLACNFLFFLWYLCLILMAGWWLPHGMSLEVFLPLQFFWHSFRIVVNFSLNAL